jgi:hypothetical protein
MTIVLENARNMLRTVIRSIDKKVDFSATLHSGDRPGVALTLTHQHKHASLIIPEDQLEGIETDSIRRAQLRTLLKRTIDRMSFKQIDIASTKMLRGAVSDGGFFRVQQSGYRGGRR